MHYNPEKICDFVSPKIFFDDGPKFKKDEKQTYDISYPEFLKYFENIQEINKHHLVIGINFTYGWMPTILDFRSNEFEDAVQVLNKVKKGTIPSIREIETLKSLFNNSLVGTSKLLHFIRPDKFAIWDSRVYRYLTGREPYVKNIGDPAGYLSYLAFCGHLTSFPEFENIHRIVCREIGYEMTKFRTAELIMYQNGEKQSTR